LEVTEFFENDYVDFSSYDNLRKICSVVDGQKNAARKVLYTILEQNINSKIKVSQFSSKVSEYAEYLHGSIDGVVVGMGQDYAGTNNMPLLQKSGNFGTRFSPDASATRYIYTYGSADFFELFNKKYTPILKNQVFEGHNIEPKFYVPNLPLLLINGSEGLSSGFAQKILPRNPDEIKRIIKGKLKGKNVKCNLIPWFKGFNGVINKGINSGQWYIDGVCTVKGTNKVLITEVPVGYNLKGYIKVLDDLEDKKIIQSYKDKSEDDVFNFEVTIPSKTLKSWTQEELLIKLKLRKTVTENYTVLDENNKIKVHENIQDILDHYIGVKKHYTELMKNHVINELQAHIKYDYSKYLFIKMIQDDELIISKRKKIDIVNDIDVVEKIIKKDDNYDYLLNMSIQGLTYERMQKLEQDIKNKHKELNDLTATSIEDVWFKEIG